MAQIQERSPAHRFATLALVLAWAYLSIVLLFGESVGGRWIGMLAWGIIFLAGSLGLWGTVRLASRFGWISTDAFKGLALTVGATLVSLLLADLAYGVIYNVRTPVDPEPALAYERGIDPTFMYGEIYPRSFHPTELEFLKFKPGVRVQATTYGTFYRPALLDVPLLADSIFDLRPIDFAIDEIGFRNRTSASEARIWALGDSFVFGFAIQDGARFVDQMQAISGEPVYSIGVGATGPLVQTQALEHVLELVPDADLERLIWMPFEGNDLERVHPVMRAVPPGSGGFRKYAQGTLFELASIVPELIKSQSLITRVRGMSTTERLDSVDPARYELEGHTLSAPLYRSSTLGPRLFYPWEIERATKPLDYVLEHPNLSSVTNAFLDLKALSERFGFEVTVAVAPTATRLHGAYYDGLPELSSRPHFIEFLNEQAREVGFDVVDLLGALQPYAAKELLYFRDDEHWNARGNRVVAETLVEALSLGESSEDNHRPAAASAVAATTAGR